jgi:demethylmenaquinone methyltransferase/2-methoxy-6-polyprenyl-1,4-benzoquinol methylase
LGLLRPFDVGFPASNERLIPIFKIYKALASLFFNGKINDMTSPPVNKSPERIRRMFSAIAPRYDLINHGLTLGIDLLWRKFTAQQLLHHQTISGDVLDVCCGTGALTLAFLKRQRKVGIERTNYGIDFSPEMLEVARRKGKGCPTLHFAVGDAMDLPFEENRFAVVAVAFGLRNVCDPQKGLAEMIRVCKPGGIVAVLDFSMPTLPILRHCYRFYFRTLLPKLGGWFGKNQDQAYHYLPESVLQFDQPDQLAERLTQLGVRNIQRSPMTFGIVTLVWGEK